MGTISDKLNHLIQTKEAIRSFLIDKGQTVPEDLPFSQYLNKIEAVSSEGGGGVDFLSPATLTICASSAIEGAMARLGGVSIRNLYVRAYLYDTDSETYGAKGPGNSASIGETLVQINTLIGTTISVQAYKGTTNSVKVDTEPFKDCVKSDVQLTYHNNYDYYIITGPNPTIVIPVSS